MKDILYSGKLTTQKMYRLLDQHLIKGVIYNLRKVRSLPIWRVNAWNEKDFDTQGICASFIEFELYPFNYTQKSLIAYFQSLCEDVFL